MSVNLAVPFFSQRENSYIWKQKYETDPKNKTGKVIHSKGEIVNNSEVKLWDGCCNITCLAMVLNYLGVTQDTPLWEKNYTTENDFILEQDITINKDEIETEIEFNFDIEKVLDEEFDGEMEIFCRIIYEEKDIASKLNSKLIVRTQGAKR
ncbi:MAG: hypothetical protein J6J11_02260 [Treponema sp.]|nr:hypothetical protein [Treponema sp.]